MHFSSCLRMPLHPLFLSPGPPRTTRRLAWQIGVTSSQSPELLSPLQKGEGWDFVRVLDEPGTFWGAGTAVTHSTNEAGQLAEQLGGPRRDSPSNNPLREPHRLGTDLARKEDLVGGHVVHLLLEGTGHLQDGVEEGSGQFLGHMFLNQV